MDLSAGMKVCRVDRDCKVLQHGCDGDADCLKNGIYSLAFFHPESLFETEKGRLLLETMKVNAVVVDECHTVDTW